MYNNRVCQAQCWCKFQTKYFKARYVKSCLKWWNNLGIRNCSGLSKDMNYETLRILTGLFPPGFLMQITFF